MVQTVSKKEVLRQIDSLINGAQPRREIAEWAQEIQTLHDNDLLEFLPNSDKDDIWQGIMYLTGVDMPTTDRLFLLEVDDFRHFRQRFVDGQPS